MFFAQSAVVKISGEISWSAVFDSSRHGRGVAKEGLPSCARPGRARTPAPTLFLLG